MDIGNADGETEALHGSDDDENYGDEYDEDGADIDLLRAKEAQYERPICSVNMDDIKSKFESGHSQSKEERREERKQEVEFFVFIYCALYFVLERLTAVHFDRFPQMRRDCLDRE